MPIFELKPAGALQKNSWTGKCAVHFGSGSHTHEFEPMHAGTIVRDRVNYQLPFRMANDLVDRTLVARDLKRIFAYRHKRIRELFE